MSLVVAIDFSSGTSALIDAVADMAKPSESVYLVHVEEPDPDFVGFEPGPESVKQHLVDKHDEAKRKLTELANNLSRTDIKANIAILRGQTAKEIIAKADAEQARMIILGSHGHGALYDLLVGSVAEYVIRSCSLPVLLVPIKK
ncbi:universal stress protein [Lacimicrobium sp. SS2-24]|uniref:universal stress protein n=1 Tax=Lacimicrobium sp. SS2-24 TaxID=2005569 RepID=UPI000B4B4041|nr:universal stress protein [Lacimicrobium sp. SS2-24]